METQRTVAFTEMKVFVLLPEIYPKETVELFLRHYFRFLDDVKYRWPKHENIEKLWELFNSIDPNIKFIFENLSTNVNFLDVQCSIVNDKMTFDVYYKPTNSFNYLHENSHHPTHPKNNIALSLAQRIVKISNINRDNNIDNLQQSLIQRGHSREIINETISKTFSPSQNENNKDLLTFTYTYSPAVKFNKNTLTNFANDLKEETNIKKFTNKKVLITTRQPKNRYL